MDENTLIRALEAAQIENSAMAVEIEQLKEKLLRLQGVESPEVKDIIRRNALLEARNKKIMIAHDLYEELIEEGGYLDDLPEDASEEDFLDALEEACEKVGDAVMAAQLLG